MTIRHGLGLVGVGAVVVAASVVAGAQSTPRAQAGRGAAAAAITPAAAIKADYDRANALRDRLQNTITNVAEAPVWIGPALTGERYTVVGRRKLPNDRRGKRRDQASL